LNCTSATTAAAAAAVEICVRVAIVAAAATTNYLWQQLLPHNVANANAKHISDST